MFDPKTLQNELHHARLARIDAEGASIEVEELIRQVQRFQPGKQRLLFMVDGCEPEPFGTAN
jgi:hypothetical protein